MLSGMIVCSFAGLIYSQLFQMVLSCMQLTQLAHFVGVILAGVYRFRETGKSCSEVDIKYNVDGNTWKNDGYVFRCLFISQCALFIPFCMCTSVGMWRGKTAGETAKDRGLVVDDDDFERTYE